MTPVSSALTGLGQPLRGVLAKASPSAWFAEPTRRTASHAKSRPGRSGCGCGCHWGTGTLARRDQTQQLGGHDGEREGLQGRRGKQGISQPSHGTYPATCSSARPYQERAAAAREPSRWQAARVRLRDGRSVSFALLNLSRVVPGSARWSLGDTRRRRIGRLFCPTPPRAPPAFFFIHHWFLARRPPLLYVRARHHETGY